MELKVGVSIDDAVKAMQAEKHEGAPKYVQTELAIGSYKKDTDLQFWTVGEGVLLLQFSKQSRLIEDVEFHLYGPGDRSNRVEFEFAVESYDTKNETMVVKLRSPKEAFRLNAEQVKAWKDKRMKLLKDLENEMEEAEQGADQPATAPESK